MIKKLNLTRHEKISLIKNYLDGESIFQLMNKTETELEETIDNNMSNILLRADREMSNW